ncbi:MAG: hypothetical protein U0935_15075 [Pirellulales bacterium]
MLFRLRFLTLRPWKHRVSWRRWVPRLLVGGVCVATLSGHLFAQEPYSAEYSDDTYAATSGSVLPRHPWRRSPFYMQHLAGLASHTVSVARNRQVRNGQVLDRTLWNYHFEEKKAELLPSGVAMLNRLVRIQATSPEVEVFVATAHDLPFRADDPEEFAIARDRLDSLRAQAVRRYLQLALRRDNPRILLCDPAPVGMVAEEAASAYRRGLRNATSVIPPGEADSGDFGPAYHPGGFNFPFGSAGGGAMAGSDPFAGSAELPPSQPGAGFALPAGDMGTVDMGAGALEMPAGDMGTGVETIPEAAP